MHQAVVSVRYSSECSHLASLWTDILGLLVSFSNSEFTARITFISWPAFYRHFPSALALSTSVFVFLLLPLVPERDARHDKGVLFYGLMEFRRPGTGHQDEALGPFFFISGTMTHISLPLDLLTQSLDALFSLCIAVIGCLRVCVQFYSSFHVVVAHLGRKGVGRARSLVGLCLFIGLCDRVHRQCLVFTRTKEAKPMFHYGLGVWMCGY